jgi:hypothetical protein
VEGTKYPTKKSIIPINVAFVALVEMAAIKKQKTIHDMKVSCQNTSSHMKLLVEYSNLVKTAVKMPDGAKKA